MILFNGNGRKGVSICVHNKWKNFIKDFRFFQDN
jgi:hypothetical protein